VIPPEKAPSELLCPSSPSDWSGAFAIGVVGGTARAPSVRMLARPLPVTQELLRLSEPVEPTEVFRFAAPCAKSGCQHFSNNSCRLVERVVDDLPAIEAELPSCLIRPQCRWYHQEGRSACLRCSQVVTDNALPSPTMRAVAMPSVEV
jgi:hypothetical protein